MRDILALMARNDHKVLPRDGAFSFASVAAATRRGDVGGRLTSPPTCALSGWRSR